MHLVSELRDIGNGIVNVTVDLACTQSSDGHDVLVASRGGEYVQLVENYGAKHQVLHFERTVSNLKHARSRLNEVLQQHDPDIVHSHTLTPAALVYELRLENKLRRRAPRYRLVTTVHNEYQRGAFLMGLSDATVCVSRAVDDAMAKRGIPDTRRRTVLNGTIGSPRRRPASAVAPADLGRQSVLVLGAVSKRKGADVVLDAFELIAAEFAELSLWFVGNPDWRELVVKAKRLPCGDRIHFAGLDREPAKYLNAATVMVMASRREPCGLVLSEAREAGTPIIASNVDGIPEVLDGGESGLLFPVGDAVALAECIRRVLRYPELRSELSEKSSGGAGRFTVKRMSSDYLDIYLEQLALRC